jgi:hypothetical protein
MSAAAVVVVLGGRITFACKQPIHVIKGNLAHLVHNLSLFAAFPFIALLDALFCLANESIKVFNQMRLRTREPSILEDSHHGDGSFSLTLEIF